MAAVSAAVGLVSGALALAAGSNVSPASGQTRLQIIPYLNASTTVSAPPDVAEANVRNAIPAAEIFALDTGSSLGLSHAALERESPGVSPNVRAFDLNHGRGYCLDDRERGGDSAYYVGGVPGPTKLQVHVVARGTCRR